MLWDAVRRVFITCNGSPTLLYPRGTHRVTRADERFSSGKNGEGQNEEAVGHGERV